MPLLLLLPLLIMAGPVVFGTSVVSLLSGGHESYADASFIFLVLFSLGTVLLFGNRYVRRNPPRRSDGTAFVALSAAGAALMLMFAAPACAYLFGHVVIFTGLAAILILLIEGYMFFVLG
jgi:hypothetical protein